MDAGSRYGTFCDDQELRPNIEYPLKHGNKVQFGLLGSKFIFERHSFITAVSRLSSTERFQLKKDLGSIGGQFAEYWDCNCTHLTVKEVGMTMNVLYAIASNVPIVTSHFWSETRKKVDAGEQLPDVNMFSSPPVAKSICNRVQWNRNVDRKGLFKNKMFIFISEQAKKLMERIIVQLEGSCVACDKEPSILVTKLKESTRQVIVVQPPGEKSANATFNKVAGFIAGERNQRLIAELEIALAILSGSCDTFCNPDFKKISAYVLSPAPILASNSATDDHQLRLSRKRFIDEQTKGNVLKRLKNELILSRDTIESEAVEERGVDIKECQNSFTVNPVKLIKASGGRIAKSHNDKNGSVAKKLKSVDPLAVPKETDGGNVPIIRKSRNEPKGGLGSSIDCIDPDNTEIDGGDASWLSRKCRSSIITIVDSSSCGSDLATEVIERFTNAIKIVPQKITVDNGDRRADGKRNFKKFKKTKPTCPQSKTIDSDRHRRLVCVSLRRKASMGAEEIRLSQYQNERGAISRCEDVAAVKRRPKRFILTQELCL
nr:unnamed protein product [Callosobruchus analis]